MNKKFVSLHTHSEFSNLDGANFIDQMVERAKELGQEALGLTDHGTLGGALVFYNACKEQGIKPIVGMEAYFVEDRTVKDPSNRYNHLCIYAKNNKGYKNLMKISSEAYLSGFYYKPRVDLALLKQYSEGLIVSGACLNGPINAQILNGNDNEAIRMHKALSDIFGKDLYLELMLHPNSETHKSDVYDKQFKLVEGLIRLFPNEQFIITTDAHYTRPEDFLAHETLLCIQTNDSMKNADRFSLEIPEFYMKSGDELWDVFTKAGFSDNFIEKAFNNTVEIASKVDLHLEEIKGEYPKFVVPEPFKDSTEYFIDQLKLGWNSRGVPSNDTYRNRLKTEVEIFKKTGFIDYMLIVADYVKFAKSKGIMVSPARGSVSGSLVAYLLEITEIDPIKYNLMFYRFLNPERISPPDIDIDIQASRRDEVREYISQKYSGKVLNIGTFSKLRSRAVVRDVCRVYEVPEGVQKTLMNAIPMEDDDEDASKSITLKKAYEKHPDFRNLVDQYKKLFDVIFRLEGLTKAEGIHAAGLVISPTDITELAPIRVNKGTITTQYNDKTIEKLGLLKIDVLGLKMLDTVSQMLAQLKIKGVNVDWMKIVDNDVQSWNLICSGQTKGVFQLENKGMRRLLTQIQPRSIVELAAIIALFRPGPARAGMVDVFLQNRKMPSMIRYGHPGVQKVLSPTYGVIIFQEQVMMLAKELAGYSDGEADRLRKRIGKQEPEEMKEETKIFESRCLERGVPAQVVDSLVKQFISAATYLFNMAHAVGYAVLAYRVAYLKSKWGGDFAAAFTNCEGDDEELLIDLLNEFKARGGLVEGFDINYSEGKTIYKNNKLFLGLNRIKFVGEGSAEAIGILRGSSLFTSFEDFIIRCKGRKVNKRVISALINAGSFRSLGYDRKDLLKKYNEEHDDGTIDIQDFIKGKTFEDIEKTAKNCTQCELRVGCKQVVFGSGPRQAEVMIVGETPGEDEDIKGIPFIGKAGSLLRDTLKKLGVNDHQVYITNVVKCRPPENRKPYAKEIRACNTWLASEINIIKPKIIIALGDTALKALNPDSDKITQCRGQWEETNLFGIDVQFMATYHPSYINRMHSLIIQETFEKDLESAFKVSKIIT